MTFAAVRFALPDVLSTVWGVYVGDELGILTQHPAVEPLGTIVVSPASSVPVVVLQ